MKLYTYDPAPNPQRLNLFIQYKGITMDTEQVDLAKGEQLSDAYKGINPFATVPALVLDDGTVLTEVIGQCAYLEALYPEKPLMGITPLAKAQVLSWSHRLFNTIMLAVAEALRNRSEGFANRALPGPQDLPQIPELVERGRMRLQYAWPEFNDELGDREWLVGDSITLADIDLMVGVAFSNWVKCTPGEECAALYAHTNRVKNALGLA